MSNLRFTRCRLFASSFLALLGMVFCLFSPVTVSSAIASDLIGVRFGPDDDKTRIVFDIIGAPTFSIAGDDEGSGRLFVDFQDMRTGQEGVNGFAGKGHIGRYQYGPNLNNSTRFLIEFQRTAKIKEIFVLEPKGAIKKHRLVVDLVTSTLPEFLASLPRNSPSVQASQSPLASRPKPARQVILTNKALPAAPPRDETGAGIRTGIAASGFANIRVPGLKPIARLDIESGNPAQSGGAGNETTPNQATPPKDVADILKAEAGNRADGEGGPPLNDQRFTPGIKPGERSSAPVIPVKVPAKITIVIDPGHGGRDPGALGKYNKSTKTRTYESHLNLAAAKSLSQILKKRGHYNVVLTRNGDTRVDLERRSELARDVNADLFISLHADGNDNKALRGSSVYTLSEKGSKRSILEARAQDSYEVYNVDIATVSPDLEATLFGVAQSYTQTENAKFANILLSNLAKVVPLVKNAQRSDDLKVLLRPDVPAVLLEMAFISNEQDEVNLKSVKWRNRTMGAVADSIDAYFEGKGAIEQVIVRETN